MKRIDSPKNPSIRQWALLKERRHRQAQGRFLIEGARELTRAMQAGVVLEQLIMAPQLLAAPAAWTKLAVPLVEVSETAFHTLSVRQKPDGVLAVAQLPNWSLAELNLPEDALLLVLDGLEKPGNLGALLRSADAVGVAAVLVTGDGTDLYNPNVIRASMGSVFSTSVVSASAEASLAFLQAQGCKLLAASPEATTLYWDVAMTGTTALILGTEHEGLSPFWRNLNISKISIPMKGLADSLNVATAGALLLYEALRQRQR